MVKCEKCGKTNNSDSGICSHCGHPRGDMTEDSGRSKSFYLIILVLILIGGITFLAFYRPELLPLLL